MRARSPTAKLATQSGALSVGAGVAINLVNVSNTANISAADSVSSNGLNMSALMNPSGAGGVAENDPTHTIFAQATSGAAGGGDLNVNGSLALNIVNVNTSASLLGADSNTSRGPPVVDANAAGNAQRANVSMTASSATSSTANALAANDDFAPTRAA